jgi:hypothetical protein
MYFKCNKKEDDLIMMVVASWTAQCSYTYSVFSVFDSKTLLEKSCMKNSYGYVKR